MYEFTICEKQDGLGIITLNSAKTLNSLSRGMSVEIHTILRQWKEDESVACVFLQGAGEKAFCAGGDVRRLYDSVIAERVSSPGKIPQGCLDFFVQEYQLDYEIHRYPKPIVVWADGIAMGGGIGLADGASHRIVTEKSKLAMPEITIGLYPDVGGTWFLNKMPAGFGLYIALTAARLNAADSLFLDLADHFIMSNQKLDVLAKLHETNWELSCQRNREKVSDILSAFSAKNQIGVSVAQSHQSFISSLQNVVNVCDFKEALLAYAEADDWIRVGIKGFESGSPSSAYVIFEQLKRGRQLNLEEVFQSELNLSVQSVMRPDFAEGVRALLVDKDLAPKWHPAKLEAVTDSWVEGFFTPLWSDAEHPLSQLGKA